MSQKDYKLEIVNELVRGDNHLRGIAKTLNTNPMNILRKLNELSKENVADFKKEGKNKTYFIKKTSEARSYVFRAENYKVNCILFKYPLLRSVIEKIQCNKLLKMAILFGSYAKLIAKEDSDIDVYIDTNNIKIKQELEQIDSRLSIKLGKFNKESLLIKEIIKNHIVLKGVEEYYEKIGFFS